MNAAHLVLPMRETIYFRRVGPTVPAGAIGYAASPTFNMPYTVAKSSSDAGPGRLNK